MSQRVYPPMAYASADASEVKTLHLVVPGDDHCAWCLKTKLRMGFHYMTEPELWALLASQAEPGEPIGMFSPSHEMVMPYFMCGQNGEPPAPRPAPSDSARAIMGSRLASAPSGSAPAYGSHDRPPEHRVVQVGTGSDANCLYCGHDVGGNPCVSEVQAQNCPHRPSHTDASDNP